jgi:hypothetical protein
MLKLDWEVAELVKRHRTMSASPTIPSCFFISQVAAVSGDLWLTELDQPKIQNLKIGIGRRLNPSTNFSLFM